MGYVSLPSQTGLTVTMNCRISAHNQSSLHEELMLLILMKQQALSFLERPSCRVTPARLARPWLLVRSDTGTVSVPKNRLTGVVAWPQKCPGNLNCNMFIIILSETDAADLLKKVLHPMENYLPWNTSWTSGTSAQRAWANFAPDFVDLCANLQ